MEISKVLIVFVFALFLVPASVSAAATIAQIYQAPNEAYTYDGASLAVCQDMQTNEVCGDNQYADVADVYTPLGDGSTSSSSGAIAKDNDNAQSQYIKVKYSVDGVIPGYYALRAHTSSSQAFNYRIFAYINDTHVNQTKYVEGSFVPGDPWIEESLQGLVSQTAQLLNNEVPLRFVVLDGNTTDSAVLTEVYLKRPFSAADFTIVASGVTETEIDRRTENTWLIVSQTEAISSPSITNLTCDFHELNAWNATGSEKELNSSLLDIAYVIDQRGFTVYWDAVSPEVQEGRNIEVHCAAYIGGVYFDEIKQFVYINNQKSILANIQQFFVYVAQLLGLAQDTNELVSGQATLLDARMQFGQTAYATTFLTYSDDAVDANASCYLDIWYPDNTVFVDAGNMTQTGADGRYTYQIPLPAYDGLFNMRSYCEGESLMNRTEYAYATLDVRDPYRMEMIT